MPQKGIEKKITIALQTIVCLVFIRNIIKQIKNSARDDITSCQTTAITQNNFIKILNDYTFVTES